MSFDSNKSVLPKNHKEKKIFYDVLVLGGQLDALLIANELKRRSLSVLLTEVLDFPQLKSEGWNKEDLEVTEEEIFRGTEIGENIQKKDFFLNNKDELFRWLHQNLKEKKEFWPFFSFSRFLKNHMQKKWKKDFIRNEQIVSLNFQKEKLHSVLLSGGKKIFPSWVIFCLAPHILVSLKGFRENVPVRIFSRLARFRGWSQIHLTFHHRLALQSLESKKIKDLFYDFKTLKYKSRFFGGGFFPLKTANSQKNQKEKPSLKQSLESQQSNSFDFMSYWLSLVPHEVLEETKALHVHIQSMKKHIRNFNPFLFEQKKIKEQRLFVESESHGFLDLNFQNSFGQISGLKNIFLSHSLYSPLPPPLSSWDVSQKTLKTLESFLIH